jgi:hypothetical protein
MSKKELMDDLCATTSYVGDEYFEGEWCKTMLDIVRCPQIRRYYAEPEKENPCRAIIACQHQPSLNELQVPEAWSGHLTIAPILFLSSNPSIDENEHYPRASWTDEEICDFFSCRFEKWIWGGVRHCLKDQVTWAGKATRYWAEVKGRAAEILGKSKFRVRPGWDYALAEVVHCKSEQEHGAAEAKSMCADLHLRKLLECSGAKIVVCMGGHSKGVVRDAFRPLLPDTLDKKEPYVVGPIELAGLERYVVFARHTNFHGPRTFAATLPEDLPRLREFLLATEN